MATTSLAFVDSVQLDTDLTSLADAIRSKAVTSESLAFPEGFVSAINALEQGRERELIGKYLSSTYVNSRITKIRDYAFYNCGSLSSVFAENVSHIGSFAFYNCSRLLSIRLSALGTIIPAYAFHDTLIRGLDSSVTSMVTTVQERAFYLCSLVEHAYFPELENIESCAFYGCFRLPELAFPKAYSIGETAFRYCSTVSTISFPLLTSLGVSAFQDCKGLIEAFLPQLALIPSGAFSECTSLSKISAPATISISSGAFWKCSALTEASFPALSTIGGSAFAYCRALSSLFLAGNSRCYLGTSGAFYSTGITSSLGTIYVPSSLIESYKTATNWTYFSTRFSALEDY